MRQYDHGFKDGLLLSSAPAAIVVTYAFAKNNPFDSLFAFVPLLFTVVLAGCAVSYLVYQRVARKLIALEIYIPIVVIPYLFGVMLASQLIYFMLVQLKISYAYVVLPLAILIVGSLLFASIVRLLTAKKQD